MCTIFLIVTSLLLLLPVIQTIFFRCQDFQSAEEKNLQKLNVFLLDQNRRNYRLYDIIQISNMASPATVFLKLWNGNNSKVPIIETT